MGLAEVLFISVGLGMDALSVALCKGLAMKKMYWRKAIIIGLYFGIFQAIMPMVGFFAGIKCERLIDSVSHWIALALLTIIGANMIKESLKKEEENINSRVDFKPMLLLSIATSIDAMAVGVTFGILKMNIFVPVIIIGITTFIMSIAGVKIGNIFGERLKERAEIFGGIILILIGIKIVIEHYI